LIIFIDPFQKESPISFALFLYFITKESLLKSIDKLGLFLILFSISYAVMYSLNPNAFTSLIWVYAILPITFYGIGKYFSIKYRSYNVYYFLLLFLALGYSFIPAISIIFQIIKNGFEGERELMLLTRDTVSSGPSLGDYFTMNMAVIGTIFVQSANKIENRIKLISLGAFIISLLCVLRVASRTQIGIALISLLVTISYSMLKQTFSKKIRLLLIIAIPLVVLYFSISVDSPIFNILDQRNNSEESIMSAQGRSELWAISLNNIVKNPFGWEMPSSMDTKYSHNLWLDVDRIGGIMPFIFLSFFTILSIYLVTKTLKISPNHLYFNNTVLVLFIGFMTVFFVEPVIEGMFYLFLIFCLFIGILSGYVKTGLVYKNSLRKYSHTNLKYNNETSLE
jgi:hypothetical protein